MERKTVVIGTVAVVAVIGAIMALAVAGQNIEDISSNADAIEDNSEAIDRNSDAIEVSKNAIADNEDAIADNRELIDSNGQQIAQVKANNRPVEDAAYEYSYSSDVYATGYGFDEENYNINADIDGYIQNTEDNGTIENVKVTLVFETGGMETTDTFYVGTLDSGERRSWVTEVTIPADKVGENGEATVIIEGDNIETRTIDLSE